MEMGVDGHSNRMKPNRNGSIAHSSPTASPRQKPEQEGQGRKTMLHRHPCIVFPVLTLLSLLVLPPAAESASQNAPDAPHHVSQSHGGKRIPLNILHAERRAEDAGADDDDDDDGNDDDAADVDSSNAMCSKFLLSFLEGTTNAEDTCDGIKNAYVAAGCTVDDESYNEANDNDDYFNEFSSHMCCQALQTHYQEYCRSDYMFTNMHLLFAMIVLLLTECAKHVVRRLKYLEFVPEAGVCILVGTVCGGIAGLFPGAGIDVLSFDDDLFMCVLLPPIIFEAALSVSKTQFKKRRTAILVFAVLGTLASTFMTGAMVHYISQLTDIPFPGLDSLVFGALISSIDPVAILSILTNLGLTQEDTVYILVLGESLLNDGIAITVFKTLVNRFDGRTNDGSTSAGEIFGAIADFLNSMIASIAVALACGCAAWFYFYLLKRTLSPAMEVGSFFMWAFVPFYISESLQWSGIVSLVVMGFFMDIYIASPKTKRPEAIEIANTCGGGGGSYVEMGSSDRSITASIAPMSGTKRIRLSPEAEKHIRFFAHVTAQLSESAIFAYLGLFLFSKNYDWDPALISIGIVSCLVSRAFMVIILSQFILMIYRLRGLHSRPPTEDSTTTNTPDDRSVVFSELETNNMSQTAVAIRNPRTQTVLVLAGLRGAVSLALVENVPLYNGLTGEGCQYKPLMKGMTSAAIIFTTFVLGGASYFLLPILGFVLDVVKEEDRPPPNYVELSSKSKTSGLEGFNVDTRPELKACASELSTF